MISPQHVDYIRFQTGRGISKEEITNSLRLNGVTDEDIQDGFSQMIANPSVMTISGAIPPQPAQAQAPLTPQTPSKIWTHAIPWTNRAFMLVALGLFFGLDTPILIQSMNDNSSLTHEVLGQFYAMMVGTLVVFCVFYFLENRVFSKEMGRTASKLDIGVLMLVIMRNIVFILCLIPVIQLLGLAATFFLGIPFVVGYTVLISLRSKKAKV